MKAKKKDGKIGTDGRKLKRKERKESYVNIFIILFFFFKICELLALKYFDQFREAQSFFSCDIRHYVN